MRLSAPCLIILMMSVLPTTGSPLDEISAVVTQAAKGATVAAEMILNNMSKTRSCEKNQRKSPQAADRIYRDAFLFGVRSCALLLSVVIQITLVLRA